MTFIRDGYSLLIDKGNRQGIHGLDVFLVVSCEGHHQSGRRVPHRPARKFMEIWVIGVQIEVAEGAQKGECAAGCHCGREDFRSRTNEIENPLPSLAWPEPEEEKILGSDLDL